MAIEILKEKEKQNLWGSVFLILLFLIFFVSWWSKRKEIFIIPSASLPPPKKIEIDFQLLQSPFLKELEMPEEISLPKEKGRENPFLPY